MYAGAIGCARGSQACIGIKPALVPKPTIAAIAITAWTAEPSCSAVGSPIAPSSASRRRAIHVPAPPRCVIATYVKTVCRAASVAVPARMIAAGTRVISSQKKRNDRTSRAHSTPTRESRKTLVSAPIARPAVVLGTYDVANASDGTGNECDRDEEDARQPVDAGPQRQVARERRANGIARDERPGADGPERESAGRLEPEARRKAPRNRAEDSAGDERRETGEDEGGHSASSCSSSACCSCSVRATRERPASSNS